MALMNTWGPGPGGYAVPPQGGGGDDGSDMNYDAGDPFAYTGGSLLTPWQGRFSSSGYGGGYSVPEFQQFNYADFGYTPPSPGRFEERYADPAAFRFADFQGPSAFKAPTAEDMQADPGYQARMDAVRKAQGAQAANQGTMRTGGFQKGLAQAVGDQASQEYNNVYGRRASEWDRNWNQAKDTYGINQGNTKQAFDTNTGNRLAAFNTRQNAWAGNANVALQEGQLGYNVAQGTYDRNLANAKERYQNEQNYRNSVASASAANAAQSYERDLGDYMRARDEFWTNQDRQYGILDNEDRKMMGMTGQYGDQMMNAYGSMGNMAVGAGDARAAGHQASGDAWGGFAQGLGDTFGAMAMYGASQPGKTVPNTRSFAGAAPMVSAGGRGNMYGYQPGPIQSRNLTGTVSMGGPSGPASFGILPRIR